MSKVPGKNSIRTDFVLLLHLSIIAFVEIGWLLFVLIMVISGEYLYPSEYFAVFFIPLIVATFLSVLSVALSNILRQKRWIAIMGTIFLLGTPLIAFVITWIGKQIARLFYLATPSDLQKTKIALNMKVKPRKWKSDLNQASFVSEQLETVAVEESAQAEPLASSAQERATGKIQQPAMPHFFGLWQSTIAALLGGILAGGMMISLNYRNMKEKTNFIIGVVVSVIGQFILVMINVRVGYSDLHLLVMISILLAISTSVYIWQQELQNEEVEKVISSKQGERGSWWAVIGFILLGWLFFAVFSSLAQEIIWNMDMPFS